jgi:hypothetical protein
MELNIHPYIVSALQSTDFKIELNLDWSQHMVTL